MQNIPVDHIRNFSIIAHIDHGKSTLADRILELTGTIAERDMQSQVLDNMEIERERGITIKSQTVAIRYQSRPDGPGQGDAYLFNLIDTPGHVDFSYEVSRALEACEGAILVVDAAQGVQAQTIANTYLADAAGLTIIPFLNKVDLPGADVARAKHEIEEGLAIPAADALEGSAKTGLGVPELLERIISEVPAPAGDPKAPLKALVFDSYFDAYRGVIALVRVVEGTLKSGDGVTFMAAGLRAQAEEIGLRVPAHQPCEQLEAGEVGYLICSIKDPKAVQVGDTVTQSAHPAEAPLAGYQAVKPMVYTGLFPVESDQYEPLRSALDKLTLNDPSLVYTPESSYALGFGFRVGFLGLLHMEVVKERLEREYQLDLIATAPSVEYRVYTTAGERLELHSPQDLPDPASIERIEEPCLKLKIITPPDYIGAIMELCQQHRASYENIVYLSPTSAEMHWRMPLAELILNFYDGLKSGSRGFATMDYELDGYQESKLVKLDILIGGKAVDALSLIVPAEQAQGKGGALASKLKAIIPRQLFDVPIQAAVGGRVLARQTVKARRKDVLAKCYGGDISRKRKLLEKQKAGKKRMKQIGNVELPQEAFLAVLQTD
ncbi:MAG: translation elongation factor 4 [Coriobacteriales bacterium]|jgi:GTP-binding protein LepA|nr:translation elongation factor 4 [Coriobacteriales bacterium]